MVTTQFIPYTYLIGWSKLNLWYYGSRYANNKRGTAHPSDLFITYFTSSKQVKEFRKIHGEPDVIQVRRNFKTKEAAVKWEAKVLRRLDVKNDPKFLNMHNGDGKFVFDKHTEDAKKKMAEFHRGNTYNKGKTATKKARQNMSAAKKGKPGRPQTEESRKKIGEANKGRKPTKKARQKMSLANKGRVPPNKGIRIANTNLNVVFYNTKTTETEIVIDLYKFCEDRSLNYDCMRRILTGRRPQHKNWIVLNSFTVSAASI